MEETTRIYKGRRGKRMRFFILKSLGWQGGLLQGNRVVYLAREAFSS